MNLYFRNRFPLHQTVNDNNAIIQFNKLVQERRNSIANALELRLTCTNSSNLQIPLVLFKMLKVERNTSRMSYIICTYR